MKTRQTILCGLLAVIFALTFAACGDDNGDGGKTDPSLSGNISISPASATIGQTLTAVYDGNETVSYQWKRGGSNLGTDTTQAADQAGSYTVTVSASGYTSKTSAPVIVPPPITAEGSTLAAKLAWLSSNAASNSTYTFEVTADESIAPHTLSYADKSNITIILKGTGAVRVVSLSSDGSLFTVESGVKLVLDENITLQGKSDNTASLVSVTDGGALEMKAGSKITGNTANVSGGGVTVGENATFTMNSGEISGNSTVNGGGGVGVRGENGTFTMNNGKISNNYAGENGGGGVLVSWNGTFTMNGGEISGNSTVSGGGGVDMWRGTFTMNGGEISGNTATELGGSGVYGSQNSTFTMNNGRIYGNTTSNGRGGGVCLWNITLTMNNGEISGNTAYQDGGGVFVGGENGTLIMNGGEITGNTSSSGGGGVCMSYNTIFRMVTGTIYGINESNASLRNTASQNGAALFINYSTAERGTFNGTTWESKGTLSATNDTIRVVDGELVQ